MADSDKYAFEINDFKDKFKLCRDKRIVLYGIGRYTATLLPHIKEYNIVGLLDRQEESIGLRIEGIPVISLKDAEAIADMIIINTTSIYWNMIYERIKSTSLPVYFRNGEKATVSRRENNKIEFATVKHAMESINENEIITFDFFDTLFLRQCFSLDDIFLLTEKEIIREGYTASNFAKIRHRAAAELHGKNSTLDEIYDQIATYGLYSESELNRFMELELRAQKKNLIPRYDMLKIVKYAASSGKSVKVVSDMYLPGALLQECLLEEGINIEIESIYVSCEMKCRKADGTIWQKIKKIFEGKKILHFGDNPNGDVSVPRSLGISAIYVPNVRNIADSYGFTELSGRIRNLYESVIYAQVINRLFNNGLNEGGITNNDSMGYIVFGPLFLTYLLWLIKEKEKSCFRRYYFFSRDGYFLVKDYEYLEMLLGLQMDNSQYLCVSRYVSMLTDAYERKDYTDLIAMPYTADPSAFLRKRFLISRDIGYRHDADFGIDEKKGIFEQYKEEITNKAREVSEDYRIYVKNMDISEDDALVDFSFRGSNQHYLCKILGFQVPCYYFFADKSDGNAFANIQRMNSCFQSEDDKSASESCIRQNALVIESMLTAPYGMIKQVYPDGSFECDEDKNNQKYFKDKEEINEGAKKFMADFVDIYGKDLGSYEISPHFIDSLYGCIMSGSIDISKEVKRSFHYDNAMFHDMDNPIFE